MKIISYKEVNKTVDGIHAVVTYKRWFCKQRTIDIVSLRRECNKKNKYSRWFDIKSNYRFGWRFDRHIDMFNDNNERIRQIALITKCAGVKTT